MRKRRQSFRLAGAYVEVTDDFAVRVFVYGGLVDLAARNVLERGPGYIDIDPIEFEHNPELRALRRRHKHLVNELYSMHRRKLDGLGKRNDRSICRTRRGEEACPSVAGAHTSSGSRLLPERSADGHEASDAQRI